MPDDNSVAELRYLRDALRRTAAQTPRTRERRSSQWPEPCFRVADVMW